MSSGRHEVRAKRRSDALRRRRRLGTLLLWLATSGCFGDWVSARPRPGPNEDGAASHEVDLGVPADACKTYVAAVAERCGAVLDGQLGHCHRELLRVMTLWPAGDASLDPRSREGACTQQLRALPEAPREAPGAELGPECRAWAEALRERCVAPLSSIPPDLRGCGADLLAFESTLGGITFGGPQDHEPSCREAARRLRVAP